MAKREKPFHLDMPFDEALRRFAQTDPQELSEPKKSKKIERRKRRPKSFGDNPIRDKKNDSKRD